MQIDIEVPRKIKVLAVSSVAMLLNDRHPNHIFGNIEIDIDKPHVKVNERGKRDLLIAKTTPIPIDEVFRFIMEEMSINDPEDFRILAAVINTLYHHIEQVFDIEHVPMEDEAPKTNAMAGIGQLNLQEIVKPGT